MFIKRLLSAIVMIALLVGAIILGGSFFAFFGMIIAVLSLWELLKAAGLTDKNEGKLFVVYCEQVIAILTYINGEIFGFFSSAAVWLMIFLIILLSVYVFEFNKYTFRDIAIFLFAFVYTCILPIFMVDIRNNHQNGLLLVWFVFIPPVASDTFAYCFGMLFGKHKLAPVVSPKKSIEGSVAGVLGAAIVTAVYGYFIQDKLGAQSGFVAACFVIGLLCGGISQMGDLAASAIKREFSIKDYSNIIPGHGGVLDRVDAIIYVSPLCYGAVLFLEAAFMGL